MLDFVKLADEHRIPYSTAGHHHCHQGWVQTHCPLCSDGRHGYHLGFSLEKGNFNCWRCGSVGRVDVITGLLRVSKQQAYRIIKKYGGNRPQGRREAIARKRSIDPPDGTAFMYLGHHNYLKRRKLYPHRDFMSELCGTRHLSGRWNWRIVFPICNQEGVIVAWMGRTINKNTKPKYKISDNEDCLEDPKGFLYGIDKVEGDSVIIVEGPTDVWKIGPGAVATLGIDWHVKQANTLRQFTNRFILFDKDSKAQKKAQELAVWLSYYPGNTEIIQGKWKDPGSMNAHQTKRVRALLTEGSG